MSENTVVPVSLLNQEDTDRNPKNKTALHVIEEIDEYGCEHSCKHGKSNKNVSQGNESLYRKFVSGQITDNGSADPKFFTDNKMIDEFFGLATPRAGS